MKKNILLIIIYLVISILFITSNAEAHALKTTGSISVLLHINPDDEPVAEKKSEILFLINDKEKKFQAENCNCNASVIENNKVLFFSPLFKSKTSYIGIFAPAIPFVFLHKGIYTITLSGEPKNPNDFQTFSVSYDIRVEKDANSAPESNFKKIFSYIITIMILLGLIYGIKLFLLPKTRTYES
jgi:hypothetical protein